jgi:hypothetical protein
MTQKPLYLCLILIIFSTSLAKAQQLKLSTTNKGTTYFVGDTIYFTLKILDEDNSTVFTSWESIFKNLPVPEINEFIVPSEPGEVKIGPFKLNYDNRKIKSNNLIIEIWEDKYKGEVIFIEAPDSVKTNERFNLNFICLYERLNKLNLTEKEFLKIGNQSSSQQIQYINGIMSQKSIINIEVAFTKKGVYLIDESWVSEKSNFLKLIPLKIVVN